MTLAKAQRSPRWMRTASAKKPLVLVLEGVVRAEPTINYECAMLIRYRSGMERSSSELQDRYAGRVQWILTAGPGGSNRVRVPRCGVRVGGQRCWVRVRVPRCGVREGGQREIRTNDKGCWRAVSRARAKSISWRILGRQGGSGVTKGARILWRFEHVMIELEDAGAPSQDGQDLESRSNSCTRYTSM